MSAQTPRLALIVAMLILVSGVAISASATTPAPEPLNATASNTTPSHQNPTEVTESGDTRQVSVYLARQLSSRLNASALATSNEEYDQGRALIGDEYDVLLERYTAVADGTDLAETAAQFNLTREQQREIIASAEQLNQTAAAYQAAVENGNESEARALARRIVQNASELNRSTTVLNQQYETLETQANLNFDAAQDALNTSQRRLTQAAGAVATREFTETNLTVQPSQSNLSATAPTVVSGRLTAVNGTGITNATIEVGIGEETVRTQTTTDGTYTVTYQPLLVPPTASALTATYTPAPAAPYLSSTATTNISVRGQPATSITVTNATTSARFADPVRVTGYASISGGEGRSRAGLPVTLQIGDTQLARTETVANGNFTLQTTLPERVPPGETNLTVGLATEQLILGPSNTTVPITVSSTPTALTVEIRETEGDSQNVTIAGELTTDDGEPLTDRSLQLRLADTPVATVETDVTGAYQATIDRSEIATETQTLTVQFTPTGSNLEASSTEQPLPVSSPSPLRRPAVVGGILALFVGAGLLVARWRTGPLWGQLRNQVSGQEIRGQRSSTPGGDPSTEELGAAVAAESEASLSDTGDLVDHAQAALDAGDPDTAVQLAYAAFRARATPAGTDLPETHWEVYDRWQTMNGTESSQVYQLTTAYEQATFAPESVSTETARTVIEVLPSVLDDSNL